MLLYTDQSISILHQILEIINREHNLQLVVEFMPRCETHKLRPNSQSPIHLVLDVLKIDLRDH